MLAAVRRRPLAGAIGDTVFYNRIAQLEECQDARDGRFERSRRPACHNPW